MGLKYCASSGKDSLVQMLVLAALLSDARFVLTSVRERGRTCPFVYGQADNAVSRLTPRGITARKGGCPSIMGATAQREHGETLSSNCDPAVNAERLRPAGREMRGVVSKTLKLIDRARPFSFLLLQNVEGRVSPRANLVVNGKGAALPIRIQPPFHEASAAGGPKRSLQRHS